MDDKDISYDHVNYAFLTKFKTYDLKKGNALNSLSVYVRAIRAIYNKAILEGLVNKEFYLFKDHKIKSAPTKKEPCNETFLKKLSKLSYYVGSKGTAYGSILTCNDFRYTDVLQEHWVKNIQLLNGRRIWCRV